GRVAIAADPAPAGNLPPAGHRRPAGDRRSRDDPHPLSHPRPGGPDQGRGGPAAGTARGGGGGGQPARAAGEPVRPGAVAAPPCHVRGARIKAEGDRMLDLREAGAEVASRRARLRSLSGLVLQLLLLALLAWYALRQGMHRIEAERDARSASARASVILDTVREPIALVDRDLRVLLYNAAFGELYGVEGDRRGEPLTGLGNGAWEDPTVLRRLADVLARDRELWDFQINQRTADDVERVMLLSARRMSLPESDEAAVLLAASDISPQVIQERQIRELNRQLEGKVEQVSDVNRELEAFSYSVSHDLRAPLRHIAGFADKLGRHLGGDI